MDNLGFERGRARVFFYVVQEASRLLVGPPSLYVKWVPALLSPCKAAGA